VFEILAGKYGAEDFEIATAVFIFPRNVPPQFLKTENFSRRTTYLAPGGDDLGLFSSALEPTLNRT
jgi:hypothetical protein